MNEEEINDIMENITECENLCIIRNALEQQNKKNQFEKGFNLLMDYWESIPDEEKEDLHKQLSKLGL